MADGSVRFLSQDVNFLVYKPLGDHNDSKPSGGLMAVDDALNVQ
jgi:hypothetical protein